MLVILLVNLPSKQAPKGQDIVMDHCATATYILKNKEVTILVNLPLKRGSQKVNGPLCYSYLHTKIVQNKKVTIDPGNCPCQLPLKTDSQRLGYCNGPSATAISI